MDKERKPVNPSLALVIAIGQMASDVISGIAPVFLRGRSERAYTTRFYSVQMGEPVVLLPWQEALHLDSEPSRTYSQYSQYSKTAVSDLKKALESALHDLRTHEHLIQAGLGGQQVIPLDIVLLADLSQPDSALLFPLAVLVESLLAGDISGRLYLLLNTATFLPENNHVREDATVYANLITLETFLDDSENNLRSRLASMLGIPNPQPQPYSVYLFDRVKEGVWEVKDPAELQTILGNSLLALLSGGLTQRLSDAVPQAELVESRAHYHSMAATALIHDPGWLVETCANRMALDILKREFDLECSLPPRLIEDDVSELLGKIGMLQDWLERICTETLFRPVRNGESLLGLHFADLEFEGLPVQEWGDAITGQDDYFGREIFPGQQAEFEKNAGVLGNEKAAFMAYLVDDLPQRVGLYPGGVTAVQIIVAQLMNHMQSSASTLCKECAEALPDFDIALQTTLRELDQAIENLPQPPALLRRLPDVFRRPALLLFDFLFLRNEHARLTSLREHCVHILEQKYARLAEIEVRRLLSELCLRLQTELQAAGVALEKLQKALCAARNKITLQTCQPVPSSLFRFPACDPAAADWAFAQVQQPPDELRLSLFEDHRFLQNWESMTAKAISVRLLDFCRTVCQPAGRFSLDNILAHRARDDRDSLLDLLLQGATPLLRPDFDRAGNGPSFQSQFFLCANPRTSILPALPAEWQAGATGDPYLALACRVRHLIPLAALNDLTRRAKYSYDSLEDAARLDLELDLGKGA